MQGICFFRKKKDYSERIVLKLAKEPGIAPFIVVGRTQSDGLLQEGSLDNLKKKYEIAG